MYRSPVEDGTSCNESPRKGKGELSDRAGHGKLPMVRDEAQTIAKHLKDRGVIRIAQARCGLDQRIEYYLQVERRPADDLQNIGGGRLLFQSYCQLARTRPYLLEQPCVFDGDDGLVGKRRHKLDLLGRKWPRRPSCDGQNAGAGSLSEQRHTEHCTVAAERLCSVRVFRIGERIRNVYRPGLECDSSGEGISAGGNGMLLRIFF